MKSNELLSKNSVHETRIEGITSTGAGVARIGGRAVFVPGAITGELCSVRILKAGKNAVYAKIESIIEPSPERRVAECPHFGKCGGCDFLNMSYSAELEAKSTRVTDAIRRIGGLDLQIAKMHPAPSRYAYRNKAIYAVSSRDGKAVTGFYRTRSHDVIPVERCLIQTETSDQAARALRAWMNRHGILAFDQTSGKGLVRHLFTRSSELHGTMMVCVCAASDIPEKSALVEAFRHFVPKTASVILNINKTGGNTVLSGKFKTLYGEPYIEERLCGLDFRVSPQSFLQVNRAQAELLYERALEQSGIGKDSEAFDLYCGTGTIALIAASRAAFVTGAEIVPEAVRDARENALRNGIRNTRFLCADASQAATILRSAGTVPDAVFLDPPRKGLSTETIAETAGIGSEKIVYVSCDPATLARDLKLFSEQGYKAMTLEAVDMFPATANIECSVLLQKC